MHQSDKASSSHNFLPGLPKWIIVADCQQRAIQIVFGTKLSKTIIICAAYDIDEVSKKICSFARNYKPVNIMFTTLHCSFRLIRGGLKKNTGLFGSFSQHGGGLLNPKTFVSSDRSSYSDSVLLYIQQQQQRPLFEILSISANMYIIIDSVYEILSAL